MRDIREKFGDGVAGIVDGCTDTYEMPKPPWLERKRAYIEHLKESDSSTRLVSASDKLHNTRAILAELRRHGLEVFERFSGKKDGTLWYYRTLVIAFRQHGFPVPLKRAATAPANRNTTKLIPQRPVTEATWISGRKFICVYARLPQVL